MKPGNVSSPERAPPPGTEAASRTSTEIPFRARWTAAARPFGPLPITTAVRCIQASKSSLSIHASGQLVSQNFVYIVDLVGEQVHFLCETLNLGLCSPVYLEIQLTTHAVFSVLPILAHHDDRWLNRSEHRQKEIQQNKWIRTPCFVPQSDIERLVGTQGK